MHFDPHLLVIPSCSMTKSRYWQGPREFAVNAMQEIEIECRRYAQSIVVGTQERAFILSAIDADQQHSALAKGPGDCSQQIDSGRNHQISDCGPGEKAKLW